LGFCNRILPKAKGQKIQQRPFKKMVSMARAERGIRVTEIH